MTGRVLVTARCRRKGHVLAEFAVAPDGQRAVHIRQPLTSYRDDSGQVRQARDGGPLADATGEVFRLDVGKLGDGEGYRAGCACGRPFLVTRRDLAAAEAAGDRVIFLDPVR